MAIIIYWSGTGNTESIANKIASDKGIEAVAVSQASKSDVEGADTVVLGCPAMGAEELEEDEFKPFYDDVKDALQGKKVLLFGSYGWGDGEWLRTWKDDAEAAGINVAGILAVNGDADAADAAEYQDFINLI